MEPMRNEIVVEPKGTAWTDLSIDSPAEDRADKELDPFVGLCVGLGLGLVAWLVILQVWFALAG